MTNRDKINSRGVAWGLRPRAAIVFAVTAVALAGFQCSKATPDTEQPDEVIAADDAQPEDGELETARVAKSPSALLRLDREQMALRDSRIAANFIGRLSPVSTTETDEETFKSPEQITRISNNTLNAALTVELSQQQIGEDTVNLRSYKTEKQGAQLIGPTLVLSPGNTLAVRLENKLSPNTGAKCSANIGYRPQQCKAPVEQAGPLHHNDYKNFPTNTTNLHTHGLEVLPTGFSDNVLLNVCPGEAIDYKIDLPKTHYSGTFWYHAHKHGATAVQLASGMEGFIIVKGGLDNARGIKGADDRQMMFQQIPYTKCAEWGPEVDCNAGETRTCTTPRNNGVVEFQQVLDNYDLVTCSQERRPTLINGVAQPTLEMKKGEVERWRFGHGGILQGLQLVLLSEKQYQAVSAALGGGSTAKWPTDTTPMHRVSLDGLATGKVQPLTTIDLAAGNRADVMVKACSQGKASDDCMACEGDSCNFYLVDKETLDGMKGWEPAGLLATIKIKGKVRDMPLPTERDVQRACKPGVCTPKSLAETEPDPSQTQKVVFAEGFDDEENPMWPYNINKGQLEVCVSRQLTAGSVADWFLTTSTEAPANWNHPYHIHVNPFQLLKIWDDKNNEVTADPDLGLYRDTLLVRRGWKYQVRTKYDDRFTGAFVFHCHILNHEDQGMMEIVEVVDKDGNVIGADGQKIPVSTSGGGH